MYYKSGQFYYKLGQVLQIGAEFIKLDRVLEIGANYYKLHRAKHDDVFFPEKVGWNF